MTMHARRRLRRPLSVVAAAALAIGGMTALTPGAVAQPQQRASGSLNAGPKQLKQPKAGETPRAQTKPRSLVPDRGRYAFLLQLSEPSTAAAFRATQHKGVASAKSAARAQAKRIAAAQKDVIALLPSKSPVLYKTHSVLAGVAVTTDVANYAKLRKIAGVSAVYPITPKSASNSYAVPLQGAPAVWSGRGDLGQNISIAVIDTGIDYTHANFGGPGTVASYQAALKADGKDADPALFPNDKVIGGYDLAGDAYNADVDTSEPAPDNNPLDCEGHGSHVAGTAAGLGENADGSTYTGAYNLNTPFDTMKIGPGMAPAAKLYSFKVFGCEGTTNLVTEAIDRAADPNGDGDPSDHVDVINMSLGSDFGSPNEADGVASNAAVDLGISVVASMGNSGEQTDVGGSPGSAAKVLAVAASQDAANRIDDVKVTIGGVSHTYGATRAVLYDWATKPDLKGSVVLAPADNKTACSAFSTTDAATIAGKVVLVEWNEGALECGSIARGNNLKAAGATGFIFANTHESFDAGINGSADIPGVLVVKSGGDAIRAALTAGTAVQAVSTSANSFNQILPGDNDKIASFSSRGVHAAGALKPDVTAVGQSVFSTAVGTGDDGASFNGTSMASPMVAGLSALVRSAHPNWTPEQVKADVMNTAGQDLYVNGSADTTSAKYAPIRVGAGRIKADSALDNDVLIYNVDDPGRVSVSFGPVEVSGPTTKTKRLKVQNTGLSTVTYKLSYDAITTVPGVSYTVSPAAVTLSPRSSQTVTVTFTVTDASLLTKTVDPTIGRTTAAGDPRDTLAEASGRILAVPTKAGEPTLRVPVYSAPRPVSAMTQASSLTLPNGATQQAALTLTGKGLNQGTGEEQIESIAAGFELQATSGLTPKCTTPNTDPCYRLPEERDADMKYVGYTSDYPLSNDPSESLAYFAVSAHGAASTPAGRAEFDVYIDVDGDNVADLVIYNTRLGEDDLFVAQLVDLETNKAISAELLDGRLGDLDAAVYDSDTVVLPVSLATLLGQGVNTDNPRINYGIVSYAANTDSPQPIDAVGFNTTTGDLSSKSLTADLYTPGVTVTDSDGDGPLVSDQPGAKLTVTRNLASYRADKGQGVLMTHLHNLVGAKAQVVSLKAKTTVDLTVTPSSLKWGTAIKAAVKVVDPDKGVPTGTVSLLNAINNKVLATATLSNGAHTFTYYPTVVGGWKFKVVYNGSSSYLGATSATRSVTVVKTPSSVTASLSPKTGNDTANTTATVTVKTVHGLYPTGTVTLRRTDGPQPGAVATGTLSNGSVKLTFKPKKGTFHYRADYAGNSRYAPASATTVTYTAK